MDSLAVAATVIQFVEFTSGLIEKGIAIHSSVSGLTSSDHELQSITKSLEQSSIEIRQSLADRRRQSPGQGKRPRGLNRNEKDLERIATDCQAIADELLQVLANLAALEGPKTKWRSFRQALRATWNVEKVQVLENRLDRFRQQMMVIVLNQLRDEADKAIREQSRMRESVERIEQLQRSSIPVGDRFVRQIVDGEQWRRDLIQMIHEDGQMELRRTADLSQLKDGNGSTPNAVIAQERRIRTRILHKLAFRNMADRERRITKAHQRTFEWIFHDPEAGSRPWSSFKDFLECSNKKIYWITGKPGSGKSTLMKYIRHQQETTRLLNVWSTGRGVTQGAFYFWNSGSRMQMSVIGLLQTLLHDCLRQLPEVVQKVLPERWEAATLFGTDDFPWSLEEAALALRRLITEACPENKFFFLIDGLDECSGNHTQLVELITELAEETGNLKLCVASRPWNHFEDAFRGRPSLMLQDLSAGDIAFYITSKFSANDGFAEFQTRDAVRAQELLDSIAKKAEGVFLWVHLVVQSLLEGLTNGDGLRDLRTRLEELPPNLEDLYANILEHLDEKYLDHASRLFQIVRACDDFPTLLQVALADLEDDQRALHAPVAPMSKAEVSAVCRNMKRKLASRCRGLLDIESHAFAAEDQTSGDAELSDDDFQGNNIADRLTDGDSMANLEVQYLHRSVRDYIQSPGVWTWLVSANEEPFDPHLSLFKSHVLQLKILPTERLSARKMGFHVWMAIKYAKRSLSIHEKNGQRVEEVVLLLDGMNKSAELLTSRPAENDHTFIDRNGALGRDHWSSFFLIRVSGSTFLHLMAVCGVHQYLEMRVRGSDLNGEEEARSGNNRTVDRTPLIIAAIDGAPVVPSTQGYDEVSGSRLKAIRVLLMKGARCHAPYHGKSAWDLALNQGNVEALELFKEYGGEPPPRPARSSRKTTTNDGRRGGGRSQENQSDNESNASTEAVSGLESFHTAPAKARSSSSRRTSTYGENKLDAASSARQNSDSPAFGYYERPAPNQRYPSPRRDSSDPTFYYRTTYRPSSQSARAPRYPPWQPSSRLPPSVRSHTFRPFYDAGRPSGPYGEGRSEYQTEYFEPDPHSSYMYTPGYYEGAGYGYGYVPLPRHPGDYPQQNYRVRELRWPLVETEMQQPPAYPSLRSNTGTQHREQRYREPQYRQPPYA